MMNEPYILCFFPVVGDTKDTKRVELLQNAGYKVKVVAFERDTHIARMPNCEIIKLARIDHGKYLSRLFIMLKSFFKLRKIIKECQLIYAIGLDLGAFSYFASYGRKRPLIIDVADIREIQVSHSLAGKIVRSFDRMLVRHVDLIVVTSKAFITEYYQKTLNLHVPNFFVFENKVDYSLDLKTEQTSTSNNKFTIGYFGYLRDQFTLSVLKQLVEKHGDKFRVQMSGVNNIPHVDTDLLHKDYPAITYTGPYQSPEMLNEIYEQVDMLVILYPEPTDNVDWYNAKRICRANRFYEACFFQKPMIAYSFSEDGNEINKYQIGFTLDNYDIDSCVASIHENVNALNIVKWKENIAQLDSSIYSIRNEKEELKNKIDQILNNYPK